MSDPVIIAAVSAVAAVAAAVVTALIGRKNVRDTNRVDEFEAVLAGLKEITTAQEARIIRVEAELQTVKTALVTEQQQHSETRELLRVAMRHIRDMLSWLGGDRTAEPPPVPDELTHQL